MSQSLTIILPSKVYDFLEAPEEVTIIDFSRRQIVFLDPQRREQAQVAFETALLLLDRLRTRASQYPDSEFQFAADPQFEIHHAPANSQWTFSSPWMTYQVKTTPLLNDATCKQFWDAWDWLTRANTVLAPGSRLPFPRLVVNEKLRRESLFPKEVILTGAPRNFLEWLPGRRVQLRSVHELRPGIAPDERERVAQADQAVRTFQRRELIEFQSRHRRN